MKKLLFALCLFLTVSVSVFAEPDLSVIAEKLKLVGYTEVQLTDEGACFLYPDKSVSVSLDGDIITAMNTQNYDKHSSPLPAVSKNDARGAAVSFVLSAAPDICGRFDLSKGEVTYNGDYSVVFTRRIKGIPFPQNTLRVTVDSADGTVTAFERIYDENPGVAEFDGIVPVDLINGVFKNGGLELCYNKRAENGKIEIYPVYTANPLKYYSAADGTAFDAEGEINPENYFDVSAMSEKANDSSPSNGKILTISRAQQIIKEMPEFDVPGGYTPVQARYMKTAGGKYLISIKYTSTGGEMSVTLDADTGVICELSRKCSVSKVKNANEIEASIHSYINNYMAQYQGKMRLSAVSRGELTVFLYERIENGIPFKSNGLCIAADKSGNITHISFLWDNAEFPETDGIISAEQAYEMFFRRCGLEIKYVLNGGEYIPAYALNSLSTGIIDAFTGEVLSYDGKPAAQKKYLAYVDLDTHYSKPYVEKMADCDIYVSRGDVALDGPIIQKDFLLLISPYLPGGKPIIENFGDLTDGQLEMLYNAFEAAGVITSDEFAPESYVTREHAASYFMKTLGYGELGANPQILAKQFADDGDVSENLRGYIRLAGALKLINGTDGRFYPKGYMSNGDSLILVYNYLNTVQGE